MTSPAAFQATYSDWKLIRSRKVVQVVLEIPLEAAGQAYDVLGGMPNPGAETWCAIARLKGKEGNSNPLTDTPAPASVEASPVRARTWAEITPAQQAGIRCNEPAFVQFLASRYRQCVDSTESASQLVRELCEVKSRSEIRAGTKSAETWQRIEQTYQTWLLAERMGAA